MQVAKGLADVVVDESAVSEVRREGYLSYRGHGLPELVEMDLVQAAHVVLGPDSGMAVSALADRLAAHADLSAAQTALVLGLPEHLHPMKVLQGMVPLLSLTGETALDQGIEIAAKLPAVVATHLRREKVNMKAGADNDYATRFLQAVGTPPTPTRVHAFNVTQILQMEHSFNAGTFTCRVVGSTLADIGAAISAAIGALSGPLHGGADQAALAIVDNHIDERALSAYVQQVLDEGGRVPGMGHREYRVRDPRAVYLQDLARDLSAGTEHAETFERLAFLDEHFSARMAACGKDVHPNVEFYKGLVYRMLGLPDPFFTAGFAMARVFGYVAHYLENARNNRIYRPQAKYIGP